MLPIERATFKGQNMLPYGEHIISFDCSSFKDVIFFTLKHILLFNMFLTNQIQSKEEGKNQETIQSSNSPDPGHHTGT